LGVSVARCCACSESRLTVPRRGEAASPVSSKGQLPPQFRYIATRQNWAVGPALNTGRLALCCWFRPWTSSQVFLNPVACRRSPLPLLGDPHVRRHISLCGGCSLRFSSSCGEWFQTLCLDIGWFGKGCTAVVGGGSARECARFWSPSGTLVYLSLFAVHRHETWHVFVHAFYVPRDQKRKTWCENSSSCSLARMNVYNGGLSLGRESSPPCPSQNTRSWTRVLAWQCSPKDSEDSCVSTVSVLDVKVRLNVEAPFLNWRRKPFGMDVKCFRRASLSVGWCTHHLVMSYRHGTSLCGICSAAAMCTAAVWLCSESWCLKKGRLQMGIAVCLSCAIPCPK